MTPSSDSPGHRRFRLRHILIPVAVLLVAAVGGSLILLSRFDYVGATFKAVREGDIGRLEWLLSLRPGLVWDVSTGESPLHAAVRSGRREVVRFLLARGASPAARDSRGAASIHIAIDRRDEAMVRLLAQSGADVNTPGPDGIVPLSKVIDAGDRAFMDILLHLGAKVNLAMKDGHTPLERDWPENAHDIVSRLLDRGVDAAPEFLIPALDRALRHGHADIVRKYLNGYSQVNRRSTGKTTAGATLLHLAAQLPSLDLVAMLLNEGANPNLKDEAGRTPLDLAVKCGAPALPVVLLLLDYKAESSAQSLYIAIESALQGGRRDSAEAYLRGLYDINVKRERQTGLSLLHFAVRAENLDAVRLFLEHGANVDTWDWRRATPLHTSVTEHPANEKMVALLLEYKADPNAPDLLDRTPLHMAVSAGASVGVVKRLLDAGGSVKAKCTDKLTAIHRAASAGNQELVKLLIECGSEVNDPDRDGKTLLHHAAAQGDKDFVVYLISKGCYYRTRDNSGNRPIRYAIQNGHQDIADYLTKYQEERAKGITPKK